MAKRQIKCVSAARSFKKEYGALLGLLKVRPGGDDSFISVMANDPDARYGAPKEHKGFQVHFVERSRITKA